MAELKRGDEHIYFDGMPTGYLLSDFWRWSSSDLLDNTLRGTYSEFIVGTALDLDLSRGFENWLPWDLTYPFPWKDGTGQLHDEVCIEVKSASYLQSWEPSKLSNIIFNIRPTTRWEPDGARSSEKQRQSDVYVFCLYAETNRRLADPSTSTAGSSTSSRQRSWTKSAGRRRPYLSTPCASSNPSGPITPASGPPLCNVYKVMNVPPPPRHIA